MINDMIKLIFCSLLIVFSVTTFASDDHDEAKHLLETGEILALEAILEKVRLVQSGTIIEVELEKDHGKIIYEIELLISDGKVLELKFDAKTGEHLSTEIED